MKSFETNLEFLYTFVRNSRLLCCIIYCELYNFFLKHNKLIRKKYKKDFSHTCYNLPWTLHSLRTSTRHHRYFRPPTKTNYLSQSNVKIIKYHQPLDSVRRLFPKIVSTQNEGCKITTAVKKGLRDSYHKDNIFSLSILRWLHL